MKEADEDEEEETGRNRAGRFSFLMISGYLKAYVTPQMIWNCQTLSESLSEAVPIE